MRLRRGELGVEMKPGDEPVTVADREANALIVERLTAEFPADPIIDSSAPANAPGLFDGTAPRAGGAPCITSPKAGTQQPRHWLRPRFDLTPAAGENLFEINLAVAGFAHPLRIFTRNPSTGVDVPD